jgi:hypothetical protein
VARPLPAQRHKGCPTLRGFGFGEGWDAMVSTPQPDSFVDNQFPIFTEPFSPKKGGFMKKKKGGSEDPPSG